MAPPDACGRRIGFKEVFFLVRFLARGRVGNKSVPSQPLACPLNHPSGRAAFGDQRVATRNGGHRQASTGPILHFPSLRSVAADHLPAPARTWTGQQGVQVAACLHELLVAGLLAELPLGCQRVRSIHRAGARTRLCLESENRDGFPNPGSSERARRSEVEKRRVPRAWTSRAPTGCFLRLQRGNRHRSNPPLEAQNRGAVEGGEFAWTPPRAH